MDPTIHPLHGISEVYCLLSSTYRASIEGLNFDEARSHHTAYRNLGSLFDQGRRLRRLMEDNLCSCRSVCRKQ